MLYTVGYEGRDIDAAQEGSVALLCFERDVTTCHRHIIVEVAQEQAPSLPVLHLE